MLGVAGSVAGGRGSAAADPPVWTDEPPVLARLIEDGYRAESLRLQQMAALRYCSAARLGSVEAQYRLGRLYLIGHGNMRNPAFATALLALAARGGHARAQRLLGSVRDSTILPACLFEGGAPDLAGTGEVVPHEVVNRFVRGLPPYKQRHAHLVQRLALRYAIDPRLALAIVRSESDFDPLARSPKNAQGLMQLMPETAERFGVRNILDPEQNVRGGLAYLRWLLDLYEGDVMLAAAAYNAGEGAVERYGGVPPYAETQAYVGRILAFYRTGRHQVPDGSLAADRLDGRG
ncbi:MAG: lytic transglycosylase domain-containing protein [Rhodocyclales bacterium]|nr:lytic transglycosylase domain-containing protein [Rhodocyclales bacterium]